MVLVPATHVREIRHPQADQIDLATVLRTVGDPVRLEIVRMLADGGERNCGWMTDALGLPSSTGSYHLRLLREAGITRTRAEGTERHISLRRDDLDERFPGLLDAVIGSSRG
jgi:DNA-binding transcriptional ArsR family regulator